MFIELQHSHLSEIVMTGISALIILGHNFWLVGRKENGRIRIEAITSDKFPESDSAIKPERIADFRLISTEGSVPIADYRVEENSLVADVVPQEGNCVCVALELHPHPITLDAEKFGGYIKSESGEGSVATHFISGETTEPQRESYAKFAKALIETRGAETTDFSSLIAGHKLEIIPQIAPAKIGKNGKLPVKVLFDGKPIRNLRVSTGCENINSGKYLSHSQTDENGSTSVEITGAGHWYVRTYYIRPHSDKENFEWESFWASVTFKS